MKKSEEKVSQLQPTNKDMNEIRGATEISLHYSITCTLSLHYSITFVYLPPDKVLY